MAIKENKNFLIELKYLFLNNHNSPTSALQYIIENIWPKYVINSTELNAYLSKVYKSFNLFKNKLNKNMMALTHQFIKDKEYV